MLANLARHVASCSAPAPSAAAAAIALPHSRHAVDHNAAGGAPFAATSFCSATFQPHGLPPQPLLFGQVDSPSGFHAATTTAGHSQTWMMTFATPSAAHPPPPMTSSSADCDVTATASMRRRHHHGSGAGFGPDNLRHHNHHNHSSHSSQPHRPALQPSVVASAAAFAAATASASAATRVPVSAPALSASAAVALGCADMRVSTTFALDQSATMARIASAARDTLEHQHQQQQQQHEQLREQPLALQMPPALPLPSFKSQQISSDSQQQQQQHSEMQQLRHMQRMQHMQHMQQQQIDSDLFTMQLQHQQAHQAHLEHRHEQQHEHCHQGTAGSADGAQLAHFVSSLVLLIWHSLIVSESDPVFTHFCSFTGRIFAATTNNVTPPVVLTALRYVKRLRATMRSAPVPGSELRVWASALSLADAYVNDNAYTTRSWSDVSGFAVAECVAMRKEFLDQIGFDLGLSERDYAEWLAELEVLFDTIVASNKLPAAQLPAAQLSPMSLATSVSGVSSVSGLSSVSDTMTLAGSQHDMDTATSASTASLASPASLPLDVAAVWPTCTFCDIADPHQHVLPGSLLSPAMLNHHLQHQLASSMPLSMPLPLLPPLPFIPLPFIPLPQLALAWPSSFSSYAAATYQSVVSNVHTVSVAARVPAAHSLDYRIPF
ncbi:hypothetical protein BC831DRAFT_489571 [Entophlyctis helioformis]|nr:hypothetical protein BC831DRAFT_489571 [Entophlyctis helioformis]